jgi:aldose 1-epimerase
MERAANYAAARTVVDGIDILRLSDAAGNAEVRIAPLLGNNAYSFRSLGREVLWAPGCPGILRDGRTFEGNPFMAPWANRLDRDGFEANGRFHGLRGSLGNFLRDGAGLPIHGLLSHSALWEVIELAADDASGARATCRLEFRRHPALMAQFPFAHTIEVTHRLRDGSLAIETRIENRSTDPMPVAVGYHPFLSIGDSPREAWRVHLPARDELVVTEGILPTGGRRPLGRPDPSPLRALDVHHVLQGLERGPGGRAFSWLESDRVRVSVSQDRGYDASVFYAPPSLGYVCLEPMAATINALNPLPGGARNPVPFVAPGGRWTGVFSIHHEIR